jgi:hypothetical protein
MQSPPQHQHPAYQQQPSSPQSPPRAPPPPPRKSPYSPAYTAAHSTPLDPPPPAATAAAVHYSPPATAADAARHNSPPLAAARPTAPPPGPPAARARGPVWESTRETESAPGLAEAALDAFLSAHVEYLGNRQYRCVLVWTNSQCSPHHCHPHHVKPYLLKFSVGRTGPSNVFGIEAPCTHKSYQTFGESVGGIPVPTLSPSTIASYDGDAANRGIERDTLPRVYGGTRLPP